MYVLVLSDFGGQEEVWLFLVLTLQPLPRSLFNRMDLEDLGLVVDWDHHLPPPAAKAAVESLPRKVISGTQAGEDITSFCCPGRSADWSGPSVFQAPPPTVPPMGQACSAGVGAGWWGLKQLPDQHSLLKSSSAPCVFWNLRSRRLSLRCLAITSSIPTAFCPG